MTKDDVTSTVLVIVTANRLFGESLAQELPKELPGGAEVAVLTWTSGRLGASTRRTRADVVLVDLEAVDDEAREAIRHLHDALAPARVVALVPPDLKDEIVRCVEAGAVGGILKDASLLELAEAIQLIVARNPAFDPALVYSAFAQVSRLVRRRNRRKQTEILTLTHREIEILSLLNQDLSNREIAERLCLSVHTVKNHVHHILEKLKVHSRSEAVAEAHRKRWLRKRAG